MDRPRPLNPWVADRRDRISFGIQLAALWIDPPGPTVVKAAKVVDDLGLDAVFLGDHPAWAPECFTHFAAMAVTTERIGLGPMVSAVPYRNPLLLARLISDLDHLSNGRFINGLGIGWNASQWEMGTNEFDRMGLPYPSTQERQAALEEAIEIIRGVWGPEPFSFTGRHYQVADAQVPPPVQQPEPPLVLGGGGEKVTLRQLARLGDVCNFGSGPAGGCDSPESARRKLGILRRHCEELGRPFDDILRSHFTHWLLLAPDEPSLQAKVRRYFPDGPQGFWGAGLIARTPEGAIQYFQDYVDAGMQYFVVQTLDATDTESLRLLAQEVAPALRRPLVDDASRSATIQS